MADRREVSGIVPHSAREHQQEVLYPRLPILQAQHNVSPSQFKEETVKRLTCNSFISSFSLFTGIFFTSSTSVSTRFTLASTPAMDTTLSLIPNSAPRGLRGPDAGTSVELGGLIAGSAALRGRGDDEGEAAPGSGDTALLVRFLVLLCAFLGESEALVVR